VHTTERGIGGERWITLYSSFKGEETHFNLPMSSKTQIEGILCVLREKKMT
jgi:hypothetical protein